MAISAADVKALREITGAGMMDCKRALEEADGDLERAQDVLRQKGQMKGGKREGRATSEGCVALAVGADRTSAVILELQCETDFVGRTEGFRELAQELAQQALDQGASTAEEVDAETRIHEAVSQMGEAIRIGRIEAWTAADGGVIGSYLHTANHRLAGLVELAAEGDAPAVEVADVGRELAMQVAAMQPVAVGRDDIPEHVLEREREVLRNSEDMANKPPQVQDKIIAGRLEKLFYRQHCLLEQEFVRESGMQVRDVLAAAGERLGAKLTVRRFVRVEVGVG